MGEVELLQLLIGGGSAGGGLASGMIVQQFLSKRNGQMHIVEKLTAVLTNQEAMGKRMDRFEDRLNSAVK